MSSLGGRRRERGKTLLSPGSGPRIIREPAIDRLTADRLAGVLSLLSSGQPAESELAESELTESEFAVPEFAEPKFAESVGQSSEAAESTRVISSPVDWVPELVAPEFWVLEPPVREDSLPAARQQDTQSELVAPEYVASEPSARRDTQPELEAPEFSAPEPSEQQDTEPELAARQDTAPAAAVPAVPEVGRHRRPSQKKRSTKKVPTGLRLVGLVVRRVAEVGLVTVVAITVGLGVLKVWG